jgi:signal peptidase
MSSKSSITTILLLVILAPFLLFAVPQMTPWFNSYIVTSGSMEPSIPTGSAIVVRNVKPSQIDEGDVITFSSTDEEGEATTTHRVIDIRSSDGEREFKTKGDANPSPDPRWVSGEDLVGKVILTIPELGRIVVTLDNVYGYALLVVIPGLLLLVHETRRIVDETG